MNFVSLINRRLAYIGVASALLFSAPVFAETTVAGVKLDDTVQIGTQTLKLNGAGIRYKVVFKVYVASMYLPELKSTTAEVLALPGATVFQIYLVPSQTKLLSPSQTRLNRKGDQFPITLMHHASQSFQLITS